MSLLYRTIQSHIKDFEATLYTTIPAYVISFDDKECTVNVQPSINEVDFDGVTRVIPNLERVPLVMPSALDSALTFPVKKGDKVLLHFCQSNIEDYLLQKTANAKEYITPNTKRKHDLDDAFATLGVRFYDDTPVKRKDTVDLYYKDTRITVKGDGELLISNDGKGSSIKLDKDGDIQIITKSKFSVSNDQVELVSLLSNLIDTLANTTVNTTYGLSPLNSKPALQTLKNELDTLKE